MRMQIFSILDRKLREFGQLVLERNDGAVSRAVHASLQQGSDSMMSKYPEDFDLYCLGEIETETGQVFADSPRLVATLKDILQPVGENGANG